MPIPLWRGGQRGGGGGEGGDVNQLIGGCSQGAPIWPVERLTGPSLLDDGEDSRWSFEKVEATILNLRRPKIRLLTSQIKMPQFWKTFPNQFWMILWRLLEDSFFLVLNFPFFIFNLYDYDYYFTSGGIGFFLLVAFRGCSRPKCSSSFLYLFYVSGHQCRHFKKQKRKKKKRTKRTPADWKDNFGGLRCHGNHWLRPLATEIPVLVAVVTINSAPRRKCCYGNQPPLGKRDTGTRCHGCIGCEELKQIIFKNCTKESQRISNNIFICKRITSKIYKMFNKRQLSELL